MSAPPLPGIFGNYTLGDFAEVVSPDAISWLPQTAGWFWLGALLLVLLIRHAWNRLQRWYHNRYRREAARRLTQLTDSTDQASLLTELNSLLKLTAMAAFSRERVARLSGEEWITFLNSRCANPPFTEEQGQLLSLGVYNSTPASDISLQQLLVACGSWVQEHERSPHV